VDALVGDASKAQRELDWKATVNADELARIMIDADLQLLEHEGRAWIDQPALDGWPSVRELV
jgi:GDPmannose 4,6-dehydratase